MQPIIQQSKIRINQFIRVPEIRLILADGSNFGIIKTYDALKMAQDQGLDLVEINPTSRPIVAKLIDFGKHLYEQKKQQQVAKKNQKALEMKEIDIRPVTEQHDLNHKLEAVKEFLAEGHKVKLVVKFRGREISHTQIGKDKLDWMLQQLPSIISTPISMEGKTMSTVISPKSEK